MATKNPDSPTPRQLRKLRERADLSQSQAAAVVYVTCRTWQNWEAGKHEMHPILWDCFKGHVEVELGVRG